MKKILRTDMMLKITNLLFAAILVFVSGSLSEIAAMNKVNNGFISKNAVYFEVHFDLSVAPDEIMLFLERESVLYRKGMDSNSIEVVSFGGESVHYPLQGGRQFHKDDLLSNETILSMSGVSNMTSNGEVIGSIGFSFPSLLDYMRFFLLPHENRTVLPKGTYLIDGSPPSIQRSYTQMVNYFANIGEQESIELLDIAPRGTYRLLNRQTTLQTIMVLLLVFTFFSFTGLVIYWLMKRSNHISLFVLFGYEKIKIFAHLSNEFLRQTIPAFLFGSTIAIVGLQCIHGGQVSSSTAWETGFYLFVLIICAEAIFAIRIASRG